MANSCIQKVNKGDIYIFETGSLSVKTPVRVIGGEFKKLNIEIPEGKKLPVEFLEDGEFLATGVFEKLQASTIPSNWDEVVERIKKGSVVVVLGAMDTGKTFFSTYISNRLILKSIKPSIIDLDLGQSDIGPPGTIGVKVLNECVIFLGGDFDFLYFVGAHSPGGHISTTLVGAYKAKSFAVKNSDAVIIDTPGWITGDGGRLIRTLEIELLEPDLIIALQRQDELEHILKIFDSRKIIRLTVSKKAQDTSPEVRKNLREAVSKKYFENSRLVELNLKDIVFERAYIFTGKKIGCDIKGVLHIEKLPQYEGVYAVCESMDVFGELKKLYGNVKGFVSGYEKNVYVGLCDEYECIGCGVIDSIDFKNNVIRIHTPLKQKNIKRIQIGSLRYTPDGFEAGFVDYGVI